MTLKERFLNAVISGEIGSKGPQGISVTVYEFKEHFRDLDTGYLTSFLPAAVIEQGQYHTTHTKFVYRVRKGIYCIHADAIEEQREKNRFAAESYENSSAIRQYAAAYS